MLTKTLLDEQIHKKIQTALITDFQVFRLRDLGWLGCQNGVLREKLNENEFTFFITSDKNLSFQQNFNKINFTIILIDTPSNALGHQSLFIDKIREILSNPPLILPKLIHVSIEGFHNEKLIKNLQNLLPTAQILFI
jgi:hypothetical protein